MKALRDGDVLTLLAISPQFANAVTLARPRGAAAALSVHARHEDPRPDPRSRGADLARLLPAQEPARAGHRGRGDAADAPARARRPTGDLQGNRRSTRDDRDERDDRTTDSRDSATRAMPATATSTRRAIRCWQSAGSATAPPPARRAAGSTRTATCSATAAAPNATTDPLRRRTARASAPTTLFDELNWDYAVIERLNRNDLTTQVIPFNLGKAILQSDEANNLALLPGDVVTVYSQKDVRVPVSRQTRLVSLEGEINSPGVYQLHARRDAEEPARARRRLHAAGLCVRARVQPRGDAPAPAREPAGRDRAPAGAVGGADRARRGEPARRRVRRGRPARRSAMPRRRRSSPA